VLGVTWQGDQLYISAQGELLRSLWSASGPSAPVTVAGGLPFGEHQADNVVVAGDGALYLGNGSTCNACAESDPRSAAVLRWSVQRGLEVVARGARNPFGLVVAPWGDIFVSVNQRDDPGVDAPPDLLEWLQWGADYGWPRCSYPLGDCAGLTPAIASFQPHCSADGMAFLHDPAWPEAYHDSLILAEWGTYFGRPEVGRRLVRVQLRWTGGGWQTQVDPFMEGLPHPLALLELPAGRLLVADWQLGTITEVAAG
jgi:glucose/arabinose dehydrogenase